MRETVRASIASQVKSIPRSRLEMRAREKSEGIAKDEWNLR